MHKQGREKSARARKRENLHIAVVELHIAGRESYLLQEERVTYRRKKEIIITGRESYIAQTYISQTSIEKNYNSIFWKGQPSWSHLQDK